MYILIDSNGGLSLEEHEDFKRFSILSHSRPPELETLLTIAEQVQDDPTHFWINVSAVTALSPASQDQKWLDAFQQMLHAVEPYGYADLSANKVKVHLEC